jgi:hypothetical protein
MPTYELTGAVIVGVEEVDVDTGKVGLEGVEECSCPRGLRSADGVVLFREPGSVDDDVVLHVTRRAGRRVPRGSGYCATHVEHRRVGSRGGGVVGVLGDDVDHLVG